MGIDTRSPGETPAPRSNSALQADRAVIGTFVDATMNAPDQFSAVREMFAELAGEPRWVCWELQTRKGRPTKVPIQVGGRNAQTNNPRTWTTLDRCIAYAKATPGVGVGIVFNGDGLTGVDLDKCIADTGEVAEWAQKIVADLASYTERTPSGLGLHVLCRGKLPNGATGTRRGSVEVYGVGRFFTCTGEHWADTPCEMTDAQEALERLWTTLDGHATPNGSEAPSAAYQADDEADTPWRKLNTQALRELGKWVPELFGNAAKFVKGKGGYRIAAADLDRDLEEDLAIMPHGIRDWGMGDLGPGGDDDGRRGKRTPIDLVLEFGGAKGERAAAQWLAGRLGKKLADFGFDHAPLLPDAFLQLLEQDPRLRKAWDDGAPLDGEGDADEALARYLRPHFVNGDIVTILRSHKHGPVAKLRGREREARIDEIVNKLPPPKGARKRKARGPEPQPNAEADWYGRLICNKQGPRDCVENVRKVLLGDPAFVGKLHYNAMRQRVVVEAMPWHDTDKLRDWIDVDDINLAAWCQQRELIVKPSTCADAVQSVAGAHVIHPLRDRLEGLAWDGTPRLSRWLVTYLGVKDAAYARAVGRKWMISAVARAFTPGCKADHALILEGVQRAYKSTVANVLALEDEWFTDEIAELGSKDSAQDLPGKWIIEIAELASMRKAMVERIKAFLSRRIDHYRPSYGRHSQDFPRGCVFIGSTNEDQYLQDTTGNRRAWPVKVGKVKLKALRADVEQLWAEAVAAFKAGETWWFDEPTEKLAAKEQEKRVETDPWTELVLAAATNIAAGRSIRVPTVPPSYIETEGKRVTTNLILDALNVPAERRSKGHETRIGVVMRKAGWKRKEDRKAEPRYSYSKSGRAK